MFGRQQRLNEWR